MKWWEIIKFKYVFCPLAVPHIKTTSIGGYVTYRCFYVFGIRVAYWATNRPD